MRRKHPRIVIHNMRPPSWLSKLVLVITEQVKTETRPGNKSLWDLERRMRISEVPAYKCLFLVFFDRGMPS